MKLSSGDEVTVGCKHDTVVADGPVGVIGNLAVRSPLGDFPQRRLTTAWLKLGNTTIRSIAVCQPPDQFCKRTGRRLAARRLLVGMRRDGFSKEDRKAVFLALCPEFKKKAA